MATLALAAVGAAVGSSLLPAGIGILGATITGATLGGQLGALAGSYVDNALFGASGSSRSVQGPRLTDLHVTASTEGAHVPRVYGRARLGGQVIWATDFEEEIVTTRQSTGTGKGIGGGGAKVTQYNYYANFAVALSEGPMTSIGRVWADGREIDLSNITYRFYPGSETQSPDSLIVAREGAGNAPAYRGVAYIVFERMPLADYGNRIPQLSFEVYHNLAGSNDTIRGVVVIPGSGEFVYATEPVRETLGDGVANVINAHQRQAATDWDAAIDQLEATLPNATSVSLVVSWFGTDLRAGQCQIVPGVEDATTITEPLVWSVAGLSRASAHVVSKKDGRPAYGGTPSDSTVIAAIRDLKARGMSVTLTPFILMDVAGDNSLPDPYGASAQAAYPWRGRITCHPAAGQPGSPDKTAAAATQIASFAGTAAPGHFALSGDTVIYSGPAEWSFRRMVLHQAHLAMAAGGVDAFVIGTELRGLTCVRSAAGTYPFVAALVALAADVKSVLGLATKVTYAADWSEYFGHRPADASGDVYFHLDPLWSSAAIDAVGIDVYWPLSDWRDGRTHLDYLAGHRSIFDVDYLAANVQGGEGYDWYYASAANRDAQVRSPITDGAGKPWVFRYKDIKSWWLNQHFNRPGGVEGATPTAWVPQSKPFWFMELGCPAVDKGTNQPNVFVDPKSIESALPYYSSGVRDDLIQRRYVEAMTRAFDWTSEHYAAGANPVSSVTGERMVDLGRMHLYCWDARPFPAFPQQTSVWGDGGNWQLGHWLNGRFAAAPLADLVASVLADYGFADFDAHELQGIVPGYVIDRIMAPRDALQPLELAYFFDSIESGGKIVFRHRGLAPPVLDVDADGTVEVREGSDLISLTRAQETELPASAKIRFISGQDDYRQAVAEGRRLAGASGRVAQADLPIVLDDTLAAPIAESWLFESWASRERASFTLPPSALGVEPGDSIALTTGARTRLVRVTEVTERGMRAISALGVDPDVYGRVGAVERTPRTTPAVQSGAPALALLDLPLLTGTEQPLAGYAAAVQLPWPGGVAVYSSPQTTGYTLRDVLSAPATMGRTLDVLEPGPEARVDPRARVRVKLSYGSLTSTDMTAMLAGRNVAAIETPSGAWEVLQFLNATLVAPSTYELSGLLRGQAGTEAAMSSAVAAGARFVLIDGAVEPIALTAGEIGLPLNWRYGPINRDIGDASYQSVSHAFSGAGLRPYAPAHVKGQRNGTGDLTITWIRRTRIGGDSWDLAEVPLSEDTERYEVDIMQGASVVRTIAATSPSASYSAAEQTADFGAAQASLAVRVYQLSAQAGRGSVRNATI